MLLCCIRHAESTANIGEATESPHSVPLTARGRDQAENLARSLSTAPDLVVMSPFQRARDTAAPTLRRFPGVRAEVWPIQEFTYLAPLRCAGTSVSQRRAWVDAYWAAADPLSVDGPGSESFSDFIGRVRAAQRRIESLHLTGTRRVLMFGHGQFIQALRLIVDMESNDPLPAMQAFRSLDQQEPIRNAETWSAVFDGHRWQPAIVEQ